MYLEHIVEHWKGVRTGLIETIGKFRDEELDFRPFATSWSVQELMLHIAQEEHGELQYGIIQRLDAFPAEYPPDHYSTIGAIQALLESVHAQSSAYLDTLDDAALHEAITTPWGAEYRLISMIDHLIDHEIHHRAELSLILGMLGRTGLDA